MINSAQIIGFLLVSGNFRTGDCENAFPGETGKEKVNHSQGDTASKNSVSDFGEDQEYFPYGETWVHNKATSTQESTPYKFTSKELDEETGLYYYGARYYDARLSRWIKPDNRLDGLYSTQGQDVFSYVHNNPVMYIDPDGNTLTPFNVASAAISFRIWTKDITADDPDPEMIATSTASLLLDLACLWPTNPLPGGVGFFVQARRLARTAEPIVRESKFIVNATRNASIEYDKSGSLKSTGLVFAGTYLLDRGSSFGALKAAEKFLPGGAREIMSQNILEGVQLAAGFASSASVETSADKIQNRNSAGNASGNKSQSGGVNPYSIDYIGSGSSLLNMLNP